MKQGSNETLGDTLSAFKVIEIRTNNFSFSGLNRSKFPVWKLPVPSPVTKTTRWFSLHVYMTLMFKGTKFEACNIHTSENIEE